MHCFVYLKNRAKHGDVMWSYTLNTWNSYRKDLWLILCWVKMLQCEWSSVWEAVRTRASCPQRVVHGRHSDELLWLLSRGMAGAASPHCLLECLSYHESPTPFRPLSTLGSHRDTCCRALWLAAHARAGRPPRGSRWDPVLFIYSTASVLSAYCQNSLWVNKCWGGVFIQKLRN